MVSVPSLWLPIIVSAVVVFVVSFILHMVLKYHNTDFAGVPNEDAVMEALRKFSIPPGEYVIPHCASQAAMKDPAFIEKTNKGPVAMLTVMPNGPFKMGPSLVMWFVYSLAVGVFCAYIAGRALPAGSHYLSVFRFAGCTAFIAYSVALWQNSIWFKRKWSTTIKNTFDGLVYGLFTGGVFGAMWPK
jgi:hypothetical protein